MKIQVIYNTIFFLICYEASKGNKFQHQTGSVGHLLFYQQNILSNITGLVMVFERISDANKVTLSVEKMSEEFFGINYFYRKSLEIRLISPKLVQIFVRRKLQFLFYCGRHCSYHHWIILQLPGRPSEDLQLKLPQPSLYSCNLGRH